jgi:hypothetical protein
MGVSFTLTTINSDVVVKVGDRWKIQGRTITVDKAVPGATSWV